MESHTFVLPGGYIDATGLQHKQVDLVPLGGREEELLTNRQTPPSMLVTRVLCQCVKRLGTLEPVAEDVVRQLLVADRAFILLMLRQLTFGSRIQSSLPCPWPDCGETMDIDFDITDIPISEASDVQSSYQLTLQPELGIAEELDIEFRLPNGADQEALADLVTTNEAEALTALLQRCITRVGTRTEATGQMVADLPPACRQQIDRTMEALAPSLDMTMELDCPRCHRHFVAPFEIQDFFFGEMRTDVEVLYREVHYLAFHYHWSEEEIICMPRNRRRRYIDILSDEIERINDATH